MFGGVFFTVIGLRTPQFTQKLLGFIES